MRAVSLRSREGRSNVGAPFASGIATPATSVCRTARFLFVGAAVESALPRFDRAASGNSQAGSELGPAVVGMSRSVVLAGDVVGTAVDISMGVSCELGG